MGIEIEVEEERKVEKEEVCNVMQLRRERVRITFHSVVTHLVTCHRISVCVKEREKER